VRVLDQGEAISLFSLTVLDSMAMSPLLRDLSSTQVSMDMSAVAATRKVQAEEPCLLLEAMPSRPLPSALLLARLETIHGPVLSSQQNVTAAISQVQDPSQLKPDAPCSAGTIRRNTVVDLRDSTCINST
jgi:hypothetical protein